MRYVPIAITPRSGSTVFCSCLESLGLSRNIGEIFNPRGPKGWFEKQLGEVGASNILRACSKFSPGGSLAIFKTSALDFRMALAESPEIIEVLQGPFLFIDRMNKVAQGISLYRAKASGVWHKPAGSSRSLDLPEEPTYDFNRIRDEVVFCEKEAEYWDTFFSENSIQVVRVIYEDFIDDPDAIVHGALRELGVTCTTEKTVALGFDKMSESETIGSWEKLFRDRSAELARRNGEPTRKGHSV